MAKRIYHINGKHPTLTTCSGGHQRKTITDGDDLFYLEPLYCERLQTLPDNYTQGVSDRQRFKALGNCWTAETIIHILNGVLKDVSRDEEIVVLSMYDGIGTGRYCLDKMGFTNVRYYAYEIDKYAKQIAMSNYPDIIQCGDAFDLRHPDWTIGY
jgi:DNA (cytosine-5)-methyltransferase 3A